MRSYAVTAFVALSCALLSAQTDAPSTQGWVKQAVTDPMTNKSYTAYVNTGHLINENINAHVSILCSGGRQRRSILSVEGTGFHADFYASLRNSEVTYAAIKVGSKIDHKSFLLSQDLRQASLSSDEVRTLLKAVKPVIQFSDTFGTTHYASFDMSSPPASFSTDCGDASHN